MKKGSLTIVGTGIQLGQFSVEAVSHIKEASRVLYLVTDPVTSDWICQLNKNSKSLEHFYSTSKERLTTYLEMVEEILSHVRNGDNVCVAFYGHPGVFVFPSHAAVRRARAEGFHARMLPGVSAEDCLFSDLNIDPGAIGCQSFEATDMLVHRRTFDPTSHLIVWQIGVIGDIGYKEKYSRAGLNILAEALTSSYPTHHSVAVYEAARYAICDPSIQWTTIADLHDARISPISTLYVPPMRTAEPDLAMMQRLGIPLSYIQRKADAIRAGMMAEAS